MKKTLTIAALLFATLANAQPQKAPTQDSQKLTLRPAIHRTYKVDGNVFVVVRDEQGNYILTPYAATEQKQKDFVIKPILIIQTSDNP